MYAAWYASVYVAGLVVVYVTHDVLGLSRLAIVTLTVPTTALLGFLGARRLFKPPTRAEPPSSHG
jgi:hypothetical protein